MRPVQTSRTAHQFCCCIYRWSQITGCPTADSGLWNAEFHVDYCVIWSQNLWYVLHNNSNDNPSFAVSILMFHFSRFILENRDKDLNTWRTTASRQHTHAYAAWSPDPLLLRDSHFNLRSLWRPTTDRRGHQKTSALKRAGKCVSIILATKCTSFPCRQVGFAEKLHKLLKLSAFSQTLHFSKVSSGSEAGCWAANLLLWSLLVVSHALLLRRHKLAPSSNQEAQHLNNNDITLRVDVASVPLVPRCPKVHF